jgi:hypothetical protein
MLSNIYRSMMPPSEWPGESETVAAEWEHDSHGAGHMTRERFDDALLEAGSRAQTIPKNHVRLRPRLSSKIALSQFVRARVALAAAGRPLDEYLCG